MSDYPPTQSYGSSYGAPDQQQHQSYLPQTYPNPYLPPDNGQASQGHIAPNYNSNAGVYGYNSTIPSFSASALASGVPPLPIFQGWNQDSIPLPPYTTQQPATQYNTFANAQQNPQYYQPASQPSYQQNVQGELSEGEFEDGAHATNTPPVGYGSVQYLAHDAAGYNDTAQRALYSKTRDYAPQPSSYSGNNYQYPRRATSQLKRQQSGSYSPYVSSPGGADKNDQTKETQQENAYAPTLQEHTTSGQSNYSSRPQGSKDNASQLQTETNGHTRQNENEPLGSLPDPVQSASALAAGASDGSYWDGKRHDARGAILELVPRGIRYPTFIQEGFSAAIIDPIFDELHFSRTMSPKSTDGHEGSTPAHSVGQQNSEESTKSHAKSTESQTLKRSSIGQGQEILDRSINGVSKGNVASKDEASSKPSAPVSAPSTAPAKSAIMTEKERTLHSKMEALRKSREERAQKAAAKNAAKSPTTPSTGPLAAIPATVNSTPVEPKSDIKTIEVVNLQPAKEPPVSDPPPISRPPIQIPVRQTSQVPVIPGLFLASAASPASTISPSYVAPTPTSSIQRKRPVAADFDEPAKSIAPFKRPFGYSDNKPDRLVIDVSEDEAESDDENVPMDLDSQADQDSPVLPARKLSDQRPSATPTPAPIPGHLAYKPFTPPPHTPTLNIPPTSLPRSSITRPELERRESEIMELKKKIAEAEARKRARQTPSGARTPQVLQSGAPEARDTTPINGNLASKVEASLQMQNMIGKANNQIALDQQKLAEAQAAEAKKAAELKEGQAEQIRLRRQRLESRDAGLEAEIQEEQARLDQLTAQVAERQAALQKSMEEKRRVAEEKARLAQEEDQLRAQDDKPENVKSDADSSIEAPQQPTFGTLGLENRQPSQDLMEPYSAILSYSDTALPNATLEAQKPIEENNSSLELTNGHNPEPLPAPLPQPELPQRQPELSQPKTNEPMNSHATETASADQALDSALQEAILAEADAHSHEGEKMDIEPLQPPESHLDQAEGSTSPDYSPILERTIPVVPDDSHEDDYEPPEATAPIDDSMESPPFSPAPPESVHVSEAKDHDMHDINSKQGEDEKASSQPPKQPQAEELLPRRNGSLPKPIESATEHHQIPLFTPYESPLKLFQKYRFHPEYMKQVSTGLRSLTYSHKIDPRKEFCRYELAGGACNDPTCDLQHFKDIALPDDGILTALGCPDEFRGEQRDRFCDGLKGVLLDLRVRKIRDFDVIASEICAHRAKFLADKSNILGLEDVEV